MEYFDQLDRSGLHCGTLDVVEMQSRKQTLHLVELFPTQSPSTCVAGEAVLMINLT